MTVANISTRWIHLGTLILVVVVAIIAGACNGDRPTSPMDKPPFEGLDLLVELSDFSIIGKVEAVSELQAIPHPRDPTSQVEYLETTVEVDRILFGSHHSRVDVHVPVYYLADNGHRMVTKAPILEPGDTAMFFLTRREELPGKLRLRTLPACASIHLCSRPHSPSRHGWRLASIPPPFQRYGLVL